MCDSLNHQGGIQKCSPMDYQLHRIEVWLEVAAAVAIFAQILFMSGWSLTYRKKFEYDDEKREAIWVENGTRVTYKA